MKQKYKDWFLSINSSTTRIVAKDRDYSFINLHKDEVPFHNELKKYIFSLHNFPETYYDVYHLHYWNEGDYFDEHIDEIFGRKWAYVCELKPSDCNTSLYVDRNEIKEGVFSSTTPHFMPPIKKGTRISVTVFGLPYKSNI